MAIELVPDGSKEDWEESDKGNERRKRFIEWMDSRAYEGSWAYIEVGYSELGSQIIQTNSKESYY